MDGAVVGGPSAALARRHALERRPQQVQVERLGRALEARHGNDRAIPLHDVRVEMHRVVWPSKAELKDYSVSVIATLLIFGVSLWLVDTGVVALLVAFTSLRG